MLSTLDDSPQETHNMGPLDTVNAFIAALERNDIPAALEFVSENCEYSNVPISTVTGPEGIASILGPLFSQASAIEWPVHRAVESGSTVFNERLDRFHMPFGWVELPVVGVWEVHDGKITVWRDYFDFQSYLKQFPAQHPS
jgi:limonene-1,2-epoxide hydrolase